MPTHMDSALSLAVLNSAYASRNQPPMRRLPRAVPSKVITAANAGHGWSIIGNFGATSDANATDVTDVGSQSVKVVTLGAGNYAAAEKTFSAPVDVTGKYVRVWLRYDDATTFQLCQVYIADSAFANTMFSSVINLGYAQPPVDPKNQFVQPGEFVAVDLPWSEFNVGSGTLSRSSVQRARIMFYDKGVASTTGRFAGMSFVDNDPRFPNGVVSLSFDDTSESAYTIARAKLDEYGWEGTLFPILSTVGMAGNLSLTEMRSMQEINGWEIGGHATSGTAHATGLTGMTSDQIETEIKAILDWQQSNGFNGRMFATPNGWTSKSAERIIQRHGYIGSRLASASQLEVSRPFNPYRLKAVNAGGTIAANQAYVDRCKNGASWLNFMFHDIAATDSGTNGISTADFNTLMDYIATAGVPVRLMSDVLLGT